MKYLMMWILIISLSGCEFITAKAVEASLNTLITQYCDTTDLDERAKLIVQIRKYVPWYPEEGVCTIKEAIQNHG